VPGSCGGSSTPTGTWVSELHLHFHGVIAEDVAAIVDGVNREDR
jgi:hypothetical protein